MFKYIIFDVDGTMIDTEEAVRKAYQRIIFDEFGRYFTNEELRKGYGVPTPKSLACYGFTDIEKAEKTYMGYLAEAFKEDSKTFDGMLEAIDEIKNRNIPLGIVTSRCNDEIEFDDCLKSFIHNFHSVVTSNDTVLHKPNGEPLLKAMEKMNANPDETLYIGDTVFDSQCAKNAGVKFALAIWGTSKADEIEADYYFKAPSDLLDIL